MAKKLVVTRHSWFQNIEHRIVRLRLKTKHGRFCEFASKCQPQGRVCVYNFCG
jgi:hypothetical protein